VSEPKVSDEVFIETWRRLKSPQQVANEIGVSVRAVYARRDNLAQKYKIDLSSTAREDKQINTYLPDNRQVALHEVQNGTVFIASDCHYWPDEETIAHQAFVKLIKDMKPQTIILNGDVFDGAQVSRHPPLMGTQTPTPKQEIEACQDRLHEISMASKNARKFWTFGNHDTRLFQKLAANTPELTDMISLFDYFPGWHTCWRVDINHDTVIKHRWHNGVHATWNNVLKSGKTLVTGHLHQLKVTPVTDYTGRRWGVDTGTLADIYGNQFTYTEGNPVNWASGFVVLTYKDGMLLPPELCEVINNHAYFRGKEVI
jgi:predicted phosphodiesterase